eukprot:365661-Chlamydomonas_euryale.AAC.84
MGSMLWLMMGFTLCVCCAFPTGCTPPAFVCDAFNPAVQCVHSSSWECQACTGRGGNGVSVGCGARLLCNYHRVHGLPCVSAQPPAPRYAASTRRMSWRTLAG